MKKLNKIIGAALVTLSLNSFAQECPVMSGEYFIGKHEESDFNTIGGAFAALECGGVEGPVTFHIASGVYNERVALTGVSGASALNTITFTSESGVSSDVTIGYDKGDATLVLVNAAFVSFENMTIDHKTATYGNCMRIDGGASNLHFKGMVFNGVEMLRTGVTNATVYFTSMASKSEIAFNECEMNNGSMGICKEGVKDGAADSKTSIHKTMFFNQHEAGIALANEDAPAITENTINTLSNYKNFTALRLENVSNQMVVTKNAVTTSGSATGLVMNNCVAKADATGQITNNSFTIASSHNAYGMMITGSTNHQVFEFNKVKLSVNAADGSTQAFCKNTTSGNDIYLENSIYLDSNKGVYTVFGNSYKDHSSAKNASVLSASADGVSAE